MLRFLITMLLLALLASPLSHSAGTEEMVIESEDEEITVTQYDPPADP